MRTAEVAFAEGGFLVAEVACPGGPRHLSAEEPIDRFAIVLVRSGHFRRRVDGVEVVADPMAAYLERPGTVQQIAHPNGADHCTVIVPPPDLVETLVDPSERLRDQAFVPAHLDLDHRALLARSRHGAEAFELLERATVLAQNLLTGFLAPESGARKPETFPRSLILADHVRELLTDEPGLGLRDLALAAGVSPFYLSRSFRHATGMTLTRYRRQLLIKRAMQRLAEGDVDLARLAADLGFSDQAHFTRVARLEAGATPGQVRAILSPRR